MIKYKTYFGDQPFQKNYLYGLSSWISGKMNKQRGKCFFAFSSGVYELPKTPKKLCVEIMPSGFHGNHRELIYTG